MRATLRPRPTNKNPTGVATVTEYLLEGKSLEWLLESATDAMIIIDREGRIIVANPTIERLFGYRARS